MNILGPQKILGCRCRTTEKQSTLAGLPKSKYIKSHLKSSKKGESKKLARNKKDYGVFEINPMDFFVVFVDQLQNKRRHWQGYVRARR